MAGLAAAVACAWWAVAPPLAGQEPPVVQPRPIVIIGGTLIDGSGGPARRNDAIVIRDGRIKAMGLSAGRKAPTDARLIDATGKWILPGFIDAAVHLSRSGDPDARSDQESSASIRSGPVRAPADIRRAPAPYLRAYLCAGVTTVLNIGGPEWTFELRNGRVDDAQSPRIGTTGPALALLAAPGVAEADDRSYWAVASSDHVAALVERLARSKPDLVAIRLAAAPGQPEATSLASAMVTAAHARKLRTVFDASTPGELRAAVSAGADVIVSRVWDQIDEDTVRRIVGQQIIIVPTMVVDELRQKVHAGDRSAAEFESACAPAASLDSLAAWKALAAKWKPREPDPLTAGYIEGERRNVRRLAKAGAMIVAGSGAGDDRVFHGPSLHWEFESLAGAGLTPMQIILSATRDAARLLGRQAEAGQVKEGMTADLVLVEADPLADIRNARRVVQTIRGGALYER
jgi:imidazolonepropionase-like amidohydrolase